jgi:hypothetical protein
MRSSAGAAYFSSLFASALSISLNQDGIPKGKLAPLVLAIAHRAEMRSTASQPFVLPIESSREQIPPQPYTALAATEQTRIVVTRVSRRAFETLHQSTVSAFERTGDAGIAHAQLPQRARRFLTEDVARRRRRDALASKQDDAVRAFGGEPGERLCVRAGQPLASCDPPGDAVALTGRECATLEVRGINGVNGLGKARRIDQHDRLLEEVAGGLYGDRRLHQ